MYFLENNRDYHRFAISINRKVGNSVERNYIKRVMKECFRLNRHLVTGETHFDLWIVAKQKFGPSNHQEARQLYYRSLKKVRTR